MSAKRFFSLLLLSTLVLSIAGCSTLDRFGVLLGNRVNFSAEQLQRHLDRHYPREYQLLGNLVAVSVHNPRLNIPRDGNRLHADFDISIEGLGFSNEKPAGHFAITSGLRYDAATYALYLDAPELESAELPLLGGRMNNTGRELINKWLSDYARSEPVYRLDSNLLDKLGSRRVSRTLIDNGKVVIELDR